MIRKLLIDKRYVSLLTVSLVLLLYFVFTVEPRGDEGTPYLIAFKQAYVVWPNLDTSPAWNVSSFYLWVVAMVHAFLEKFLHIDLVTSARLLSLSCWVFFALLFLNEDKSVRWKSTLVLFNPYVLIYATRAHPMVIGLLLVYFFWKGVQNRSKLWGLWILFAVTFQVYTGGVAAMLLPESIKDIRWKSICKPVLGGLFAVSGVLVTWAAWGGMYPEAYVNNDIFKIYHVDDGTPSFGIISLAFMISGGVMWVIGDKPLRDTFIKRNDVICIFICLMLLSAVLYFGKTPVGVFYTFIGNVLPEKLARVVYTLFFSIMGLGWLRVERNRFSLFAGVLGCSVLIATLPYLYERLAIFCTLAPSLIWILLGQGKKEKVPSGWITLVCLFFWGLACVYQLFGVL